MINKLLVTLALRFDIKLCQRADNPNIYIYIVPFECSQKKEKRLKYSCAM